MVEKKRLGVLHTRIVVQLAVSLRTKMGDELYRKIAMVKGHDCIHRGTVAAFCPFQDIHPGHWLRDGSLTAWHMQLWNNVKPVNVREVEGRLRLQQPAGIEDATNLSDEKT